MISTLFSYRNIKTPLHTLSPLLKLLSLFVFCAIAAVPYNVPVQSVDTTSFQLLNLLLLFPFATYMRLGVALFLCVVIFFFGGHNIKIFLKLHPVIKVGVFVTAVKVFNVLLISGADKTLLFTAIFSGALYTASFLLCTFYSCVIFETTSFLSILYALNDLPLLNRTQVPIMLTLCISFIGEVFEISQSVNLAAAARSGNKKKSLKLTFLYETQKLCTLLTCLIQNASNKHKALQNRM